MNSISRRSLIAAGSILATKVFSEEVPSEQYFNSYVTRAVDELASTRLGLGYAAASYTHDLPMSGAILKATKAPLTMCVAAQVEIISKALEIYEKETGSKSHWNHVPVLQWRSLQPFSLRGRIWIVKDSASNGTAHALEVFGMGRQLPFESLQPGAFINLNREKTGHAVVFLAYINRDGLEMEKYDTSVAGFKYFSAQGKINGGGFGYRYAFFSDAGCPILPPNKRRDCGVIRSKNFKLLCSGQMLHPNYWSKSARDKALALTNAAKGLAEGYFDSQYFDGITTDD